MSWSPPPSQSPSSSPQSPPKPTTTRVRSDKGRYQHGDWYCDCPEPRPASIRTVKKDSPNRGRLFYACPIHPEQGNSCDFFLWYDDAKRLIEETSPFPKMKQTTLEKYRTPRKEKRKQQEANPVTELAVPMAVVNGASTSAPLPRSTNGPSATTETSTLRGRSEGALLPPVEIYDTTSEEEEIDSPTKPRITTHNDVRASKMAQAATTPSACSKGKRPADAEEENYSDFSSGAEEEVVALMERPVGKTPCTLGIRTPPQTKGKLPTRRVLFSKTEMSGPSTSNTSKRQCLGNGSTPCNSFSAALINLTTASLPSSTAREPHAELTQEVMHLLKDTAVSDPVRQTVRNALEKHAAQTKRLKARVAELQAQVENLEQTSQTIKAKLLTIYQEL